MQLRARGQEDFGQCAFFACEVVLLGLCEVPEGESEKGIHGAMFEVKLKAVRSAGFPGGWQWIATIPGGRKVNASGLFAQFMAGDSVEYISNTLDLARYYVEEILRAMMVRRKS